MCAGCAPHIYIYIYCTRMLQAAYSSAARSAHACCTQHILHTHAACRILIRCTFCSRMLHTAHTAHACRMPHTHPRHAAHCAHACCTQHILHTHAARAARARRTHCARMHPPPPLITRAPPLGLRRPARVLCPPARAPVAHPLIALPLAPSALPLGQRPGVRRAPSRAAYAWGARCSRALSVWSNARSVSPMVNAHGRCPRSLVFGLMKPLAAGWRPSALWLSMPSVSWSPSVSFQSQRPQG